MKRDDISQIDLKILKEKYKDNYDEALKKLKNHYPIQYLIGDVEFLNTKIKVDERVLIPRFETELLVEKTLDKMRVLDVEQINVLDLGCGSGCISIAIKKSISCKVTGIDISAGAIELAIENAKANEVEVDFTIADMSNFSYEGYNVIISNPPYVSLDEEVAEETKYEPQNAIFAKNKGLFFYESILKKIAGLIEQPKLIALEIGMTQGKELKDLASKYLENYHFEIEKDLTGRERYVFLTLKTLSFLLQF